MSIYLSVCLSVCLSTYLSIYRPISLSIYLSIYLPGLSVYLPVFLPICLSIHLSAYLSIYLSVCLSVCLSVYLSVCLSLYLSVCLSVCLSIYLYICVSVYDVCVCAFECLNIKGCHVCFPGQSLDAGPFWHVTSPTRSQATYSCWGGWSFIWDTWFTPTSWVSELESGGFKWIPRISAQRAIMENIVTKNSMNRANHQHGFGMIWASSRLHANPPYTEDSMSCKGLSILIRIWTAHIHHHL